MKYAAGNMQGWRLNMEDAHITDLKFDNDSEKAMFAVFDGHGGREVAAYCGNYYT
jgi:serine/threonine protein phosphatase PrpC